MEKTLNSCEVSRVNKYTTIRWSCLWGQVLYITHDISKVLGITIPSERYLSSTMGCVIRFRSQTRLKDTTNRAKSTRRTQQFNPRLSSTNCWCVWPRCKWLAMSATESRCGQIMECSDEVINSKRVDHLKSIYRATIELLNWLPYLTSNDSGSKLDKPKHIRASRVEDWRINSGIMNFGGMSLLATKIAVKRTQPSLHLTLWIV